MPNLTVGFLVVGIILTIGLWSEFSYAGCYTVRDLFTGRCPTWEELNGSSSEGVPAPQCICNKGNPVKCYSPELLTKCASSVINCEYIEDCVISGGTGGGGGGSSCTKLDCTACVDTDWQSNGAGYEIKKTGGTCSGNTCTSNGTCSGQTIEYRCATGYCGATTDGKTGCTAISTLTTGINICTAMYVPGVSCPSDADACQSVNKYPPQFRAILSYYPGFDDNTQKLICEHRQNISTGHIRSTTSAMTKDGCTLNNIEYYCAAGFWGTTTNGTSGCSACPAPGTSTVGTQSQFNCYLPTGTSYSDSTGTYEYTSECYYTN